MSNVSREVIIPYTADQMYELVNDINAYSTFIPLCVLSEVHEQQDNQLTATIRIAKGKLGFEFTTKNTMEKGRSIFMSLEKGPFKSLTGVWLFTPMGVTECMIEVHFDFEFSQKMLAVAFTGLFKQLCNSMIESFSKQADIRYG